MRASTSFVRTLIRNIGGSAANPAAFVAALNALLGDTLSAVKKGRVLISTSSLGTTTSFALPPLGSLGQEDVMEAAEKLLTVTESLIESESPATTAELLALLKEWFTPTYSTRLDHSTAQIR